MKVHIFRNLYSAMEPIQGPDQDGSFVQIFLKRHPACKAIEKLIHETFYKFDQFFADRRIFVSGEFRFQECLVERGNDEADVAEEGVAAVVDELQDVHWGLVSVGRSFNVFLQNENFDLRPKMASFKTKSISYLCF